MEVDLYLSSPRLYIWYDNDIGNDKSTPALSVRGVKLCGMSGIKQFQK